MISIQGENLLLNEEKGKTNINKKNINTKLYSMKNILQIRLIILCMIFLSTILLARADEWKTKKTKDGKITVKYKISKQTDKNSNNLPLIEYIATTTDVLSIQNCISVMKNVSKHKEFQGDKVSRKIKTISENEWVVYYYTKIPGPLPDSDCVAKMIFSEDPMKKMAAFKFTAAPSLLKKTKVRRFTNYNVTYRFRDLGNGKVKITVIAKMSSTLKVPLWMVRAAFPDAASYILRKFTKLAKES